MLKRKFGTTSLQVSALGIDTARGHVLSEERIGRAEWAGEV